jgi:CheY-like chemotaxis protein
VVRDGEDALGNLYRTGVYEARVRGNPEAVLFDLKLAETDGLEMLRCIKTDTDLKG